MKLCRFQPQIVPPEKIGATSHPEVLQGVISGETVREVSGEIFGKWTVTDRSWPLTDVKLADAGRAEQNRMPRQKLRGPCGRIQ